MLAGFASQTGRCRLPRLDHVSQRATGPSQPNKWLALAWAVLLHDLGKPGTFSQSDHSLLQPRPGGRGNGGKRLAPAAAERESAKQCENWSAATRPGKFRNAPATQRRLLQDPHPLHLNCTTWIAGAAGLLDVHGALPSLGEREPPVPPQLCSPVPIHCLGYRQDHFSVPS